jgi:DNA helicase-2/ATP-dependent DNA helicase PcrA
MVDEVQDLTTVQFGIAQAVGSNRITYAGDRAQGIYSFAGAEPDAVFEAILSGDPEIVELDESYRSSPAVLDAVNVLAAELGSTRLRCGDPGQFPDRGRVVMVKRDTPEQEATALLPILKPILAQDEGASIGVIVRRSSRGDVLREALREADLPHEDWSVPTHVPKVAALLRRFVREAVSSGGDPGDQLAILESLCRDRLEPSDAPGLDEVSLACEDLRGLVGGGLSVEDAVASCRQAPPSDAAVAPGLHVLNGHLGKGQEFDWVVVLGLEDGHIPDFRAANSGAAAEIQEELRVLHVIVSRARYGLVLTRSAASKTRSGYRSAADSRWLPALEAVVTSSV